MHISKNCNHVFWNNWILEKYCCSCYLYFFLNTKKNLADNRKWNRTIEMLLFTDSIHVLSIRKLIDKRAREQDGPNRNNVLLVHRTTYRERYSYTSYTLDSPTVLFTFRHCRWNYKLICYSIIWRYEDIRSSLTRIDNFEDASNNITRNPKGLL